MHPQAKTLRTAIFWAPYVFVLITLVTFFVYLFATFQFRVGDGNAYLYMAHLVTRGHIPYRDFFLPDPPLPVIALAVSGILFQNIFLGFIALPLILQTATAVLLFLLLQKLGNKFAPAAPAVYLFSLIILRTSSHFTGSELAIFFSVLAFFLWEYKKPGLCGAAWGLACMSKLYSVAPLFGFLVYILLSQERRKLLRVLFGLVVGVAGIITPFLILIGPDLLKQILVYHFLKKANTTKALVFQYLVRDSSILLGATMLANVFNPVLLFLLPATGLLFFFLIFPDVYYLYWGSLLWYMVIISLMFAQALASKPKTRLLSYFLLLFLGISVVSSGVRFHTYYRFSHLFTSAPDIATYIRRLPEPFPLYGSYQLAPLISLLSDRPIYDNLIDAHPNAFNAGIFNTDNITKRALATGVYLMVLGEFSENGEALPDVGTPYLTWKDRASSCSLLQAFPASLRQEDAVILYRCKK